MSPPEIEQFDFGADSRERNPIATCKHEFSAGAGLRGLYLRETASIPRSRYSKKTRLFPPAHRCLILRTTSFAERCDSGVCFAVLIFSSSEVS